MSNTGEAGEADMMNQVQLEVYSLPKCSYSLYTPYPATSTLALDHQTETSQAKHEPKPDSHPAKMQITATLTLSNSGRTSP